MAYNVSRGTMDAQHLSASTVVYASTELVTEGNLNISGNTNLGDNAGDVITVTGRLTGSQGAYFGGRVGVVTATPDQMLEVSGAVHMAAEQSSPSAPAAGDGGLMYVKPDGNLYWVSDDVSEVSLSSGGGGGISWDGSTANGVATFKDADEATVEANLTFDGTNLKVAGNVSGSGTLEMVGATVLANTLAVSGTVSVAAKIEHAGDTDTYIDFTTDDINFQAGGVNFLDLTEDTQNEVTFNEGGVDIDFRVETADESHMLFIEGSSNRMSIGDNTGSPGATLEIKNHASAGATGVPLLQLNNNDTDQQCVDINAGNIDANVVNITANDVTTARVLAIGADGLTTGNALYVDDNSANTGTRNTALIIQNNAAAINAQALAVQSDGGKTGVKIDKNYSDTTEASIVGLDIDWDKTGASTSDNTMYGIQLDMDNTTATNGTNYMYGLHVTPTLTHAANAGSTFVYGALINAQGGTNGSSLVQGARIEAGGGDINYGLQLDVEDGGVDLRIESSADSGDYFQIQTTTHGATTITTVDDNATAAHLTFTVDGDITLDPAGGDVIVDGNVSGSGTLSAKDLVVDTNQNIGCAGDTDLLQIRSGKLRIRGELSASSDIDGQSLTVGGEEVVSKTRALKNLRSATVAGPVSGSGMGTFVGGVMTEGNLSVTGSTALAGRLTGSQGGYFAGRVGINDNAPGYDLTLSGAMHFNGNLAASTPPASAGKGGILFGSGSGKLYWSAQEVLPRDISNQYFHKPVGCNFSRASAATVTLNPGGGIDGVGRVSLYKDSTKDMIQYNLTASITADLSKSGLNGLDTGSEASDTGYYMYVICKDEGLLPGLLFSTSNINPTMPSGYTYRSQPVWFVANDGSSNILEFKQQGSTGWCWYSDFQNAIDNGQQLQAAGWAAVSFENLVPAESEAALLLRISADITAGATTVRLTVDNSTAPASGVGTYFVNRLSANGDVASTVSFIWGVGAPSTAMYYAWTADPGSADQGFRVDIGGWKLW